MSKEKLLSTGDVAKRFGVTTQQVRYLVKVGEIEPAAKHDRSMFFADDEVERVLKRRRRKSWRDKRVPTPNVEIAAQLDELEASRDKHEYGYEHPSGLFRIPGRRERFRQDRAIASDTARLAERREQVRAEIPESDSKRAAELLDEFEALTLQLDRREREQRILDPREPDTDPHDHHPLVYAELIAFFMAEGASFEQAQAVLIRDAEDEAAEIAIRKVTPELAEAYLRERQNQPGSSVGPESDD